MKTAHFRAKLHFLREFASSLDQVELACRDLRIWLLAEGLQKHQFRIELILRESLNNGVLHGNKKDERLRVELEVRHRRNWTWARVRDQGSGFDWRARIAGHQPSIENVNGRGLAIACQQAERVKFNRKGNQIFLLFRTAPKARAAFSYDKTLDNART